MRLCQIVALANGVKGRTQKSLTEVSHKIQKTELLSGISRTYRPRDEEGETLPPEAHRVHYRVEDALLDAERALTDLFDIVATQDMANTGATADVAIGKRIVLAAVPVTHLLFLEKQLVDFSTLVGKLPTLDTSEEWEFSQEANCYATDVHHTIRTKKVPRNHVKAEATKEHPAQVDTWMEDVQAGTWDTVKFSGAIPESRKIEIQDRARKLLDAVKVAREEANSQEIADYKTGREVFDYLLRTSASSA